MTFQPSSLADAAVPLTRLPVGTTAQLHGVDLEADDAALLQALGLIGSCRLKVCQAGDPWIVQVREARIGLTESVAQRILAVPETP